jgi:hypothetical protein
MISVASIVASDRLWQIWPLRTFFVGQMRPWLSTGNSRSLLSVLVHLVLVDPSLLLQVSLFLASILRSPLLPCRLLGLVSLHLLGLLLVGVQCRLTQGILKALCLEVVSPVLFARIATSLVTARPSA